MCFICFPEIFVKVMCLSLCVHLGTLSSDAKKNVFPAADYSQKIESTFDPSSHLILTTTLRLKKA